MKLDLSARSAGIIFEFCTWGTNSEMRPWLTIVCGIPLDSVHPRKSNSK